MPDEPQQKGFFGADQYTKAAFGRTGPYFPTMAASQARFAAENLGFAVIPDVDEKIFDIAGDDPSQVQTVRDRLFGYHRRELWSSPNLAMEFQQLVGVMIEYRHSFTALGFLRADAASPWQLTEFAFLYPPTIKVRRRKGKQMYEQLAVAPETYPWDEQQRDKDYWFEFSEEEVFHLEWPLGEPPGPLAPARAAARAGRLIDRRSDQSLRTGEAAAYPDEAFLTVARARAGRYRDALEQQKIGNAKVADVLFGVPTEPTTEYFLADRLVRARAASARIRRYLLAEFNRQVIDVWRAKNEWAPLQLTFRPRMLEAEDWEDLGAAYKAGQVSMKDLETVLHMDQDEGHAFGRLSATS